MPLEIRQIPCLSDNYGYLVHDPSTGQTATIDTPDANAINEALGKEGWTLTHIFNTHHHFDHTGGHTALKEQWGCEIIGPRGEAAKIPDIDRQVGEGDIVELGTLKASVYDTPGHTNGHIVFHFPSEEVAFVGDTIFALGCGRLFEGPAEQMWTSLSKIAAWPGKTKLFCAHEYTQANAQFALSVDPDNQALKTRAAEIDAARAQGLPTVPMTVEEELRTSPFMRADQESLKIAVGMGNAIAAEVFAEVRTRKDNF